MKAVESPLGPITFEVVDGAITALTWGPGREMPDSRVAEQAAEELTAYFSGALMEFTVPLEPKGGAFQQRFLNALRAIPYGETRTYGERAKELDTPAQAIGQACGANPIPIMIPCHRVLGATSLGGFSGRRGVEDKVALLRLEGAAGLLI